MTDSKAKGNRGEVLVRDELRKRTGLQFEKTPASGALGIKGLKGDLFLPASANIWTIEVKNYEEDGLGSQILLGKGDFLRWWEQVIAAAKVNQNKPMLIYKWNRSKMYCAIPAYQHTGISNRIVIKDEIAVYALDELNLKELFEVK